MIKGLEAIKAAQESGDHDHARELADAYVAANPDEFAELSAMSLPDLVNAVDVFRAANMADGQWRAEAWLYHHFEPQNVGGEAQHQIRIPTNK